MPLMKKISSALKSQDLFAVPVSLTYRGETHFTSVYGGCLSLIMIAGLIAYFLAEWIHLRTSPEHLSYPPRYDFSKKYA